MNDGSFWPQTMLTTVDLAPAALKSTFTTYRATAGPRSCWPPWRLGRLEPATLTGNGQTVIVHDVDLSENKLLALGTLRFTIRWMPTAADGEGVLSW